MFPYPSGAGLHVGHPKGYIATDVVARMKMMQGYNVLHPMGWDAFGLPAENYALKNKVHPSVATEENIKTFKKQLGLLGLTYDWDREVNTTDPEYYKWTQWAFIQMFKRGLAFESYEPINWCPECKTGLANEDLENGLCERCGSVVVQKPMRQWVLKITDYAERLLNDIDKLDKWPTSIKEMQKNWIGKSEGATVKFSVISNEGEKSALEVFTTRPDTLFGATYCVIAPEHELIMNQESRIKNYDEVKNYVENAKKKTTLERTDLQKEKTGVEVKGIKAINPVNNEELPIFVADYVLGGYGTGAIMAVPAHDERDFEFAKKYNLPIKRVVAPHFVDPANPPHSDLPTTRRKTIHVIIRNPKDGKVLLLNWFTNLTPSRPHLHTLVLGGIEEGENLAVAAIREAQEETGYKNFKFLKEVDLEVHTEYYTEHKGQNRYAEIHIVELELEDEEREKIPESELKNHEPVWVEEKEVPEKLNVIDGPIIWGAYKNGYFAFTEDGVTVNSEFLNNLKTPEAKTKIIAWLEEQGVGKRKVQYKLRDWVFSRQRYWGEPIPLVNCGKCGWVSVPELELPLKLPEVKNYEPSGTGESPLANIEKWVNTICPVCGGPAKRETNTMPQWAGSCWYYLAYCMLGKEKGVRSKEKYKWDKEKINYWNPVDLYVGGAEHATRHLIYARFWHKFLFDIGVVANEEPFTRLQNVGLILAEDGRKMSKRWNNVINPNDMVDQFGADAMRLYEMFMGPFDQPCAWSTNGVVGTRRFLEKVWWLSEKVNDLEDNKTNEKTKLDTLLHQTIKKVTEDIEAMRYNTAISQLMILVNEMSKENQLFLTHYSLLLQLLAPFAPHVSEELWYELGNNESIFESVWPQCDNALAKSETFTLAIQINGKLRETIEVSADISEEEAKAQVLALPQIQKWLEDKEPKKIIYVKGKLISIVV